MSTEKNDETTEKQNSEQKNINQQYISSIEEMHKEEKYGDLSGKRIVDAGSLTSEEPAQPPFYKKYLTKKCAFGVGGALVVLFTALYFIFTGSPKKLAEDYINAIAAADYGKAYQCLDVKEQPTLGSAAYLQFVEFARSSKEDNIYKISQHEIKSVDLVEGEEKNGAITFTANIVVKAQNKEEEHKYTLYLEKQEAGPFGVFTNYRISGNDIYAVPKINCLTGTEQIAIDNVKPALNKPVFYGWHDVECSGKFYDTFRDRAVFSKDSGMLKLDGKKFKLNNACTEALAAASKEFTSLFFPATLTDNGYKECKTISGEKTIDEMYSSFRDGFKQVGVSFIDIKDGQVLSAFAGDNGNIHCQYQYSGVYAQNGESEKQCVGTISFEYVYDGAQLVVAKINDYSIHLKD